MFPKLKSKVRESRASAKKERRVELSKNPDKPPNKKEPPKERKRSKEKKQAKERTVKKLYTLTEGQAMYVKKLALANELKSEAESLRQIIEDHKRANEL